MPWGWVSLLTIAAAAADTKGCCEGKRRKRPVIGGTFSRPPFGRDLFRTFLPPHKMASQKAHQGFLQHGFTPHDALWLVQSLAGIRVLAVIYTYYKRNAGSTARTASSEEPCGRRWSQVNNRKPHTQSYFTGRACNLCFEPDGLEDLLGFPHIFYFRSNPDGFERGPD